MRQPNLILTGFMATGKTTIAKRLANQLNYEWIDTDEMIVQQTGLSVAQIFQKKGEPVFRALEKDLAQHLSTRQGLVISTGGGMLLNPENVSLLSQNGQIFCLTASPEEILRRISDDTHAKRPLLESPDPMNRIKTLLKQREEGYARFTQIDTSGKTPEQVVSLIMDLKTTRQAGD